MTNLLTPNERTAALLVYLFACLAYPGRRRVDAEGADEPGWYEWITDRSFRTSGFGGAVLWALRMEDEAPTADPSSWLEYVSYVKQTRRV